MIKNKHIKFGEDARSFSSIETFTDHRLVKARINMKWYKMQNKNKNPKLNLDKLRDRVEAKYQKSVEAKLGKRKIRNMQGIDKYSRNMCQGS